MILTLLNFAQFVSGQSLDIAKRLINQGNYLEAVKQLRLLANDGNAEAQFLAAQLFYEGKGVAANEAQGNKYASLAADQGYEDAILLLVDYYEKVNPVKYIQTIEKYLKPVEYGCDVNDKLICRLGYALVRGYGINKNEERGWGMIQSSVCHLVFINERKIEGDYYNYRAKKSGYYDMESFCDHLYGINDDDSSSVLEYLLREKGFDIENDYNKIYNYYLPKAKTGNRFAMALLAALLMSKNKEQAFLWAKKAKDLGSGLGTWILKELTSEDFPK